MKYIDYDWDVFPDRIILDSELNIDKLGWKHGDYFQVTNINGRAQLIKVDPIYPFSQGLKANSGANNGLSKTSS